MIKKLLVPILKICKSKFIKIEDPRFANREVKQIGTKFAGFREETKGQMPFHQREQIERELAEERHQQAMEREGERLKEIGQRKEPSDTEILGPSDSALKKNTD